MRLYWLQTVGQRRSCQWGGGGHLLVGHQTRRDPVGTTTAQTVPKQVSVKHRGDVLSRNPGGRPRGVCSTSTKNGADALQGPSGDSAPIRCLPSAAPPPAPLRVWAWPARRACGRGLPGGAFFRLSESTSYASAVGLQARSPRPLSRGPAPFSRAGRGPGSGYCWLESQGLPCCEPRPGRVPARRAHPDGQRESRARPQPCPTPAARPAPASSRRKLGTCWQVKSGKGAVTLGAGARDGEPVGTEALSLHLPAVGTCRVGGSGSRGAGTRREWACMLRRADPPPRAGSCEFPRDPKVRAGDGQQVLLNACLRTAGISSWAAGPGGRGAAVS